jgi:hypothetical protein
MERWRFYAKYIKKLEVHEHERPDDYEYDFTQGFTVSEVFSVFGGERIYPSLRFLLFELATGYAEFPDFAVILSPSVLEIELVLRIPMKHDDVENYLDIIAERSPNLTSLAVHPRPWLYPDSSEDNLPDESPLRRTSSLLLKSLSRLSHLVLLKIPSCWTTNIILSEVGRLPSLRSLDFQDFESSCNLHTSITSSFTANESSTPALPYASLSSVLIRGNLDRLRQLLKHVFDGCNPVHLSLLVDQEDMAGLDEVLSIPGVEEFANSIAGRFPQLQALSLECKGQEWTYCLDGGDVQLFTSCTLLTVIEFVGIEFNSDDELTPFFKNWPNVRALTLVSLKASIICIGYQENYNGKYESELEPCAVGLRDWFGSRNLSGLSMGCLSLMAERLPRLERLVISVTANPARQCLWPFESLTYLELRSSFLNYLHHGFSAASAAKYLSSLLQSNGEFVFTMDPSLVMLPGSGWSNYKYEYKKYFKRIQETVNGYLEVRKEEKERIADRGGRLSREQLSV